ncbi:EF-hand calcium-binding domain-containing protein 14 [Callorhinchus milii]|uniref:EF-hand calcium-binding domain-containing protein 14 n=1 Tax=Callorhinchus milii TaxID=7868 RepID=UPI001C3F9DA4|nr:EF-hand calcium-binding domain-containing protein 14 [Callorhinchus milii]
MPELKTKEKYVLLGDDSDGENEEYNKMKLSSVNAQHGKRYSASRFRCFAWCQPQWICHSFFILLLLLSQVGLFLYVLNLHGEIAKIKVGQTTRQQKEQLTQQSVKMPSVEGSLGEGNAELKSKVEDLYEKLEEITFSLSRSKKLQNAESDVNHPHNIAMIDKKISTLEDDIIHIRGELGLLQAEREELKDNVERMNKMTDDQEFSSLYEFIHKVNESSVSSSTQVKGKIHAFDTLISDLTRKLSTMETSLLTLRRLINTQANELYQFEESVRKVQNGSDDLKTLQIQLDQRLDNVYQQISQLRDEFYQEDNALNRTNQTDSDMPQFHFETTTYSPPQTETTDSTSPIGYERKHQQVPDVQMRQATTESFTRKPSVTNVVVISSIKSLRALQSFFYQADWAARGYLTYEDLMNNLGERVPQEEEIKPFDENNDGRFSYLEIKHALGLQE